MAVIGPVPRAWRPPPGTCCRPAERGASERLVGSIGASQTSGANDNTWEPSVNADEMLRHVPEIPVGWSKKLGERLRQTFCETESGGSRVVATIRKLLHARRGRLGHSALNDDKWLGRKINSIPMSNPQHHHIPML